MDGPVDGVDGADGGRKPRKNKAKSGPRTVGRMAAESRSVLVPLPFRGGLDGRTDGRDVGLGRAAYEPPGRS